MTKKMVIWENDLGKNYLLDPDELEEHVITGDHTLLIHNIDVNTIITDDLTKKLETYVIQKECDNEYFGYDNEEIEEFLHSAGYQGAEVEHSDDYEQIRNILIFDEINNTFDNLNNYETWKTYRYHNGNNWITVVLDEITEEIEVTITEDYVSLDEWDGRNNNTGGIGQHQYIHKILEIDNEAYENRYLLHMASQWQGSHDEGYVLTDTDLKDHLEELGRDVSEYMVEIEKLN